MKKARGQPSGTTRIQGPGGAIATNLLGRSERALPEACAKRCRPALEATSVPRCRWPREAEGRDVDETAAGLCRARKDARWEALLLCLSTWFAAIEAERIHER